MNERIKNYCDDKNNWIKSCVLKMYSIQLVYIFVMKRYAKSYNTL